MILTHCRKWLSPLVVNVIVFALYGPVTGEALFAAAVLPVGMRMGYPQPRGAMPPIWVMTEATLDHTKIRR